MTAQNNEHFQQLMRLRHLTELTNALHEAQLFQFKMWSAVLFNKESTIEIVNKPQEHVITYIVRGEVDNLEEKSKQVMDWTRTIVGPKWDIEVKHKRKRSKVICKDNGTDP